MRFSQRLFEMFSRGGSPHLVQLLTTGDEVFVVYLESGSDSPIGRVYRVSEYLGSIGANETPEAAAVTAYREDIEDPSGPGPNHGRSLDRQHSFSVDWWDAGAADG